MNGLTNFKNKKLFIINSANRISGTDSNFSVQLEIPPQNDYDYVAVVQAVIPKSYYMVQSGDYFILTEGATSVNIEMPVGNYNIKTFQIVCQSYLQSNSPNGWTYTLTFPNTSTTVNTGKYTYSVSGNTSQPSITVNTDSNLYQLMGFSEGVHTFVGDNLTSDIVVKMMSEDVLFIRSNMADNEGDNILQEVYAVASESYSNIVYRQDNIIYNCKKLSRGKNNVFTFWLTNENNDNIELNGINWLVTLCIFSIDDVNDKIKDYIELRTLKN